MTVLWAGPRGHPDGRSATDVRHLPLFGDARRRPPAPTTRVLVEGLTAPQEAPG